MLQFTNEFLTGEERENFYVDATMKSVWAAELEVLAEISRICDKHQLQWYADSGTLLGAVRHQGFIPWDDDVDISLKRDEYERLMQILPEELPDGWILQHSSHGGTQPQFWACVLNSNTVSIDSRRLERFHGCPFIVGVDIFPLDFIPDNTQEASIEADLFRLIWGAVQLARVKELSVENKKKLEEMIDRIEEFCGITIRRDERIVTTLWTLANKLTMSYTEKDGTRLTHYLSHIKRGKLIYDKDWYADAVYLPFESFYIPVPQNYDEVLRATYGDYMKKIRDVQSHEYPYYAQQVRLLRDKVKEMEHNELRGDNNV